MRSTAPLVPEPGRIPSLIAIAVLRALIFVMVTVVGVAIPAIAREMDAGTPALFWVSTAYLLGLCAPLVALGRIGDRVGHRRVLLAGLVVYGAASFACALAPGIELLIVARAFQGVGAAAILPGLSALMVWVTPPRHRGRTAGLLIGLMMLGVALGPLLGALLVTGPGWRTIFLLAGAIPLALLPLVLLRSPETGHDPRTRVPRLVSIAWAAGIAALLTGISRAPVEGLFAPSVLALVGAGIVLLGVAIRADRADLHPVLDRRITGTSLYVGSVIAVFGYQLIILGFNVYTLRYLSLGMAMDPVESGLALLPALLPVALVAPLTGFLVDRYGHRRPVMAGFLIVAVACLLLAVTHRGAGTAELAGPFILFGVGLGLILAPSETAAMARTERGLRGTAAGLFQTSRESGGAVGVALISIIYAALEAIAIHDAVMALPQAGVLEESGMMAQITRGVPSVLDAIAREIPEMDGVMESIVAGAVTRAYTAAVLGSAVVALVVVVCVRVLFPARTVAPREVPADVVATPVILPGDPPDPPTPA